MSWYILVIIWGAIAGGICFVDCKYSKTLRSKTYVGNALLTVVMQFLYFFLPVTVIASNFVRPESTYLIGVYLIAFVVGLFTAKFIQSARRSGSTRS